MYKIAYFQLFILFATLIFWKLFYTSSCAIFITVAFVVISFLTLSFAEGSLLYRKSVAHVIFYDTSWMFVWLQSKWIVLLKSLFQAMFFGILLLINIIEWQSNLVLIMSLDILFLIALYIWLLKKVKLHVKEDVQHIVAKKIAISLNIIVMTPILITTLFYSNPPTYLEPSLTASLQNAQTLSATVQCGIVKLLYSYDLFKEAFAWWGMMQLSLHVQYQGLSFLGWTLFLSLETLYMWIYSKLILSTTNDIKAIF